MGQSNTTRVCREQALCFHARHCRVCVGGQGPLGPAAKTRGDHVRGGSAAPPHRPPSPGPAPSRVAQTPGREAPGLCTALSASLAIRPPDPEAEHVPAMRYRGRLSPCPWPQVSPSWAGRARGPVVPAAQRAKWGPGPARQWRGADPIQSRSWSVAQGGLEATALEASAAQPAAGPTAPDLSTPFTNQHEGDNSLAISTPPTPT